MGISLVSGASNSVVTVDPTSKAMRTGLYTSSGTPKFEEPLGSYMAPINMGQLGTPAAGSAIWAIRNGDEAILQIRRILVNVGYAGVAAATTQTWQFWKFRNATHAAGTIAQVVRKRTTDHFSRIIDFRQAITALTATGVVYEDNPFFAVSYPRQPAGPSFSSSMEFTIARQEFDQIEIGPTEGIALRVLVVGVAGDGIQGGVFWDEVESSERFT